MAGKIDDRRNVICFGDSITCGEYVSPHHSWPILLSAALEEYDPNVRTILAARNGDTTRLALERMPFDVQRYERVDVLIVQFGFNDCNRWESDHGCCRVNPRATIANLIEIIERGLILDARIVLVLPHKTKRGARYDEAVDDLHRQMRLIAPGTVDHIPLDTSAHLLDGLHLNEEGHRVYFEAILPVVIAALKERASC